MSGHTLQEHVGKIIGLEDERDELKDTISDAYTLAESDGFDKKLLRQVIAAKRKGKLKEFMDDLAVAETYAENL